MNMQDPLNVICVERCLMKSGNVMHTKNAIKIILVTNLIRFSIMKEQDQDTKQLCMNNSEYTVISTNNKNCPLKVSVYSCMEIHKNVSTKIYVSK